MPFVYGTLISRSRMKPMIMGPAAEICNLSNRVFKDKPGVRCVRKVFDGIIICILKEKVTDWFIKAEIKYQIDQTRSIDNYYFM